VCSLGLPTASHTSWPVYPVQPGASTIPAPRLPSGSRGGSEPRPQAGCSLLLRGVSFPAAARGKQRAAEPLWGRTTASPLASPRSGMAPRNPSAFPGAELSRAAEPGCGGSARRQPSLCPPGTRQALAGAPQHPAWPLHRVLRGGTTACRSPSHLLPARGVGDGTGLAAAPAWAQGI